MRLFSIMQEEKRAHRVWWAAVLVGAVVTAIPDLAAARFASRFSMSAGEEYNDNILFSENKTHDFVTVLTPALHFLYQPEFRSNALLTVDLNSPAEIFARHSELTNIGDRFSLRSRFHYPYSPRLSFSLIECVGRIGRTRLGGGVDSQRGGNFQTGQFFGGSSGIGGSGGFTNWGGRGGFGGDRGGDCGGLGGLSGLGRSSPGSVLSTNELVTSGDTLTNDFELYSSFSYSSNLTFDGRYRWRYKAFFDAGGKEDSQELEAAGRYRLWPQHTLRVRYRFQLLRTRNGKSSTIHDFDVGDDFYGSRQINLTPTLWILASTGLSVGTENGFRLRHNLDISLVKIWRTAVFIVGARRQLTGSFGVSGPSYTTDLFTNYTIQLSRRWTAFAAAAFSIYEVDGPDFETFQALAGMQYWLTSWMSANLVYNYRRLDPGKEGVRQSEILRGSITEGNSIVVSLSAYFDIWPNVGFARGVATNAQMLYVPSAGPSGTSPISGPQPGEQTSPPNP